ncbi:MAG: prepilin-type N-terminal cleavage/methylation domain-containing protein [Candidatus Saccharibacteria bacterium]
MKRGFTIVELLVVIVVIGILAAITIVSYTGVTARANGSATKSNAQSVYKKIGIFQVDSPTSSWPISFNEATGATTSSAAYSGATFNNNIVAAASTTAIGYAVCGITNVTSGTVGSPAAGPTTIPAGATAVSTVLGVKISYNASDTGAGTMETGKTSGTATPPGSASTVVNTILCVYTGNAAGTTTAT